MVKSVARIVFLRVLSFVIFLILLGIANYFIPKIPSVFYLEVVNFFNTNILFLFGLMFVGLINEIFWSFYFPFNALAPITGAGLGVMVFAFIVRIWDFIREKIGFDPAIDFESLYAPIALVIIAIGYVIIAARGGKPSRSYRDKSIENERDYEPKIKHEEERRKVEWKDVSHEFKLLFYNIGRAFNRLFEGSSKKETMKDRKSRKKRK